MSHNHRPMSIDAMLDMERKEVLALLENSGSNSQSSNPSERIRSASPYGVPRSPVRSLLDIAEEGPARPSNSSGRHVPTTQAPVRSMLDIDTPPASPPPAPIRSMLDIDTPLPSLNPPGSPTLSGELYKASSSHSSGSRSGDTGTRSSDYVPRMPSTNRNNPIANYQFSDILSHQPGVPNKRNHSKARSNSAMADALRNADLSSLSFSGDNNRRSSMGNRLGKSKSPHNRLNPRSRSPATFSSMLPPNKVMLGDGQIMDMNSAYRRLSDANLAISGGSLSQLPLRKQSDQAGEGRLVKDYLGPDGEHLGSSDEDDDHYSSDEDRGRKMAPRSPSPGVTSFSDEVKSSLPKSDRQAQSLLAAAEDERVQVASQQPYKYRSLLPDPEIKVTNTSGDTVKASKAVHPHTSFDHRPGSATPSIYDSDDEADVDDIKRAQNLSFSMTSIVNTPEANRSIRIIYRGEYSRIAKQADDERARKYLVATDLSDESTHALEWAIGTVLRDGDTLIAIYCVDEETGIVGGEGTPTAEDVQVAKEQVAALSALSSTKSEYRRPSAFHLRGDSNSTPGSSPARGDDRTKASEERTRAVQVITDKVLRLLRKTRLQVRVVVEVLHCKNPKHLITEVIDHIEPTLVVIGSRGRSALKGVILGSFSNYLVTKSSVPVMVARKRLRKHSKYKRDAVRQVNNLTNPAARSLANAKID
ncbi:Usp domain-containing protein [Stachybotrys elegans]|uniref:Usp domain-containing protein n=1 Tax=Stachybotrys elegans TaxID=80388 RepID=A0A8K0SR49_9HYPO|nr:Usp domain-containing protein [Stachybotrys elegans]